MADEVILAVSELAANAALHSNSGLPGGTFIVRAIISPGRHVRIEVEDSGGAWTRAASDPTGHHGLDIIRALATDWGSRAIKPVAPSGQGSTGPHKAATRLIVRERVRTFFTVIKGTPPARRAIQP